MWYVWWIVIALALGIVEVLTVDLIFLMIAVAALLAGVASALGLGLGGQVVVFAVAAVVLLFLVRPWAKSHLLRTTPDVKTNAQGLVGREGTTLTRLSSSEGRVRIDGEVWSARTRDGGDIPPGLPVTVVLIDGATAVVERLPGA